jgi:hypothetical protein
MTKSSKSKNIQAQIDDKDTKKIWVTLPKKYSDILDILADDIPGKTRSNRKSVTIEKMLDEYLETHQKELKDDGRWDKIISVRKRAAKKLEKSLEEKIHFVNIYVQVDPELEKLIPIWNRVKDIQDTEGIDKIYRKIFEIKTKDDKELDLLLENL